MAEEYLSITRRGNIVTARNELLQVNYNLATGMWSYVDKTGYTVIRNAYAKIVLQDGTTITTTDDGYREFITEWVDDPILGRCRQVKFSHQVEPNSPRVNIYLRASEKQPYIILSLGVENPSDETVSIAQMDVIDISPLNGEPQGGIYLGRDPTRYRAFLDTYTKSSTGIRKIYDGFSTELMTADESQYNGLLYDMESKRALVFGFLTFKKWWSAIRLGYNSNFQLEKELKGINTWALYQKCENKICTEGEELHSEPIYLNFNSSVTDAQQLYTQLVAQLMGAVTLDAIYSGWTHWKNALQEMNEEHVIQHADWIAKNQDLYPIMPQGMEYVQIDLGWQKWCGSNEADTEHFPHGMEWLAEQIHDRELKAGICITPFCVELDAPVIQSHPEYMLHDSEGNMIQTKDQETDLEAALFDLSHPDAQEYIRKRVHQIINEWQYDLIKVDLLSYARGPNVDTTDVVYHDNSLTSVEVYRLGMQLLADAVESSDRTVILTHCCACNSPSIGLMRSNYSSAHHIQHLATQTWEDKIGCKSLVRMWAARLSLNDIVWTNDFGVMTIGESYSLNEAQVLITAAALSGGIISIGNNLMNLNTERAEIFSKILPLYGETATPVDLYDNDYPQIWHLNVKTSFDNWSLVGVFNWDDGTQDISFDFEQLGLSPSQSFIINEFWSQEYLGEFVKCATFLDLPPRSVELLCIRAQRKVPQLLSTDMHFTQGGVEILSAGWDARSHTFLAVCRNPKLSSGSLFIYVPDDYVPASIACFGAEYNFRWHRPIYQIKIAPAENIVNVSVHFGKISG